MGPQDGATAYGVETVPLTGRPDDETRDSLAVNFGGVAAEMAVLSEGTLGGRSDVSSATQTALGRISAGLTDDPAPLDLDWLDKNVAASLKEALAGALVAPLAAARARAIAIVGANLEPIRRFAATLEAAGELTGEALGNAIADAGFVAADGQPATD